MSQEKLDVPVHKPNEKVVPTGSNEASVGFSGSNTASTKEEGAAKKPQVIDSAEEIPDWKKIGWKRVSEFVKPRPDKKFNYDEILKELYYNDYRLYSGAVFISLFTTYFIVSFGGGLGWVFVICAFIATHLKISVTRFYRNAKSDASREIAKQRLEEDDEKVEWLNEFLRRFWLIYEPVLSATIIQIADSILIASTPGFLDSIRLTSFTLGTKPPVIESVRSYPRNADDEVVMDWRVSFVPNDLANMTKAQLAKKVNPKVILTVRVGRGIVGAGIPILLENMSFTGLMRVKLKLIPNFPHIESIDLSFIEEPVFDYVLKPIGGETLGFDIGIIPGLSSFIREQVHANLRPMMYAPNSYTLLTKYLLYGFPVESSIGVLKLAIKNAKSLRNAETFGTSDPYCKVILQPQSDVKMRGKMITRTKYIKNSLSPVWDETHYLLFNNLKDHLKIQLFDSNGSFSTDTMLGDCPPFHLESLVENPNQTNSTLPVMHNKKQQGELNFDAVWYPVATADEKGPPIESNTGILKVNIHQAKELDPKFSMLGLYNPYAMLNYNGKNVFRTKTYKRTNNPIWEEFFEIFVKDRKGARLSLDILDERGFAEDPLVGSWNISVDELLRLSESKNNWLDIKNARSGKLRLSCQWKPVILDHVPENSEYVKPIGIVKLHIKKATDLKNLDRLRGKSDPYVRILLNSIYKGRTVTRDNDLNPTWNEYFYMPVHSLEEKIQLQCFDHENKGEDRNLGLTEFGVNSLIKESDDGKLSPAELIDTAAPLSIKGSLFYSASFQPALYKEEGEKNEIDALQHQSGILIVKIVEANFKKKSTYVEVFINNDRFPVHKTFVSDVEPYWNEDADLFIKELDSSTIIFDIKRDSKSVGKAECSVKELIEKYSTDENVRLPIKEMANCYLNVKLSYIPVKFNIESHENNENVKDTKPLHSEIPNKKGDPEISNKKGGATGAITGATSKIFNELGGSKVGSLLRKKDKDEKKKGKKEDEMIHKDEPVEETLPKDEPVEEALPKEPVEETLPPKEDPETSNKKGDPEISNKKGGATGAITGATSKIFNELGGSKVGSLLRKKDKDEKKKGKKEDEMIHKDEPIEETLPKDEPVEETLPKDEPIEETLPKDEPVEETLPKEEPIEETLPKEEPVKEALPKEEPEAKETISKKNSKVDLGETEQINAKQESKEEPIPYKAQENHIEASQEKKSKPEISIIEPYNIKDEQEGGTKESPLRRSVEVENIEKKQDEDSRSSEEEVNNNGSSEIVSEPGILTISVIEAKDLIAVRDGGTTSNSYVKVKMNGKKEILKTSVIKKSTSPKWDEEVTVSLTGSSVLLSFFVQDHNVLSKDDKLGKCAIQLWDYIKPGEYDKDLWIPLSKEDSQLHIKLKFTPQQIRSSDNGHINRSSNKRLSRLFGDYDNDINIHSNGNGHGNGHSNGSSNGKLSKLMSIRRKK